jgi:hypothetical protein
VLVRNLKRRPELSDLFGKAGRAMFAVSSFARMRHVLHGLWVVHLRVFMVYGRGQSARTKPVPYAITSLLQEARPKLFERYPPRRLGLSRHEASPRLAAPNNTRRRLRSTVDWHRADLEGTHSLASGLSQTHPTDESLYRCPTPRRSSVAGPAIQEAH